jgi:hypothetical protein
MQHTPITAKKLLRLAKNLSSIFNNPDEAFVLEIEKATDNIIDIVSIRLLLGSSAQKTSGSDAKT